MATLEELQAKLTALTQRVNEITAPPDDYYTHRFSGEEIDNAVGRVADTPGSGAITAGDVGAAPAIEDTNNPGCFYRMIDGVQEWINPPKGTIWVSVCCALLAGTLGTLIGYAVSKNRRSKWANYVNSVAFLPYLMPSIAVGVAFFILFSSEKINLFNTYTILIIVGTIKYIPFASRSSLNSMLQLSGEIEEAAIIQNIPWVKRMTRIIIPIQKSSIISGYLLPFMTCLRELSLFMLLCVQGFILSTTLDYFDEMGLYAFSSGINLILIITILVCNTLVNKVTGASLDKGIGG